MAGSEHSPCIAAYRPLPLPRSRTWLVGSGTGVLGASYCFSGGDPMQTGSGIKQCQSTAVLNVSPVMYL